MIDRPPSAPPDDVSLAAWWRYVAEMLRWNASFLIGSEEPEMLGYDSHEERVRKEPEERREAEKELAEQTRAFLSEYLLVYTTEVNTACKQMLFFAEERLRWGASCCEIWASLPATRGVLGLEFEKHLTVEELMVWVSLDCYDSEFSFPKRWCDGWTDWG